MLGLVLGLSQVLPLELALGLTMGQQRCGRRCLPPWDCVLSRVVVGVGVVVDLESKNALLEHSGVDVVPPSRSGWFSDLCLVWMS